MSLQPSSSMLITALTIWFILALSNNVGECQGLGDDSNPYYDSPYPMNSLAPSKSPPNPSNNSPLAPSRSPSNTPINPNASPLEPSVSPFSTLLSPKSRLTPSISPSSSPHDTLTSPLTSPISQSSPPPNLSPSPLSSSISPSNPPKSHPISPLTSPTSPSSPPPNPTPNLAPSTSPSNPSINHHINALAPSLSPSSSPLNPSKSPLTPSISPFSSPLNPSTSPPSPLINQPNPLKNSPSPLLAFSISPSNPPLMSLEPSQSPSSLPSNPSNSSLRSSPPPLNPPSSTTSISPAISPIMPENFINSSKPLGLQVGFYRGLCPNKEVDVEATIVSSVQEHFRKDSTLLAALLRMQFHDCFVHGCDASILIDGASSEKNAGPNLSVRGYEFIDALKEVAEVECPGVVSCADIIAIATKELIKLGGGQEYLVQTGRRDGLVSNIEDVRLPSPFASVTQVISAFKAKNFTTEEMVLLLGGHTVGISHCVFFQDRLYKGTSLFDPKMDRNLRRKLMSICPQDTITDNLTSLDQNPRSTNLFDNSFFDQILKQRGILPIDQALARDSKTQRFVLKFARNAALFNAKFVDAMVKLQALDVLTGNQGEIRKVCSKFN